MKLKDENLQKFYKLNLKQKVSCLLGIIYFVFYIFKENLISLSKTARIQKSVKYINNLLIKSNSQLDYIDNENFDESKVKFCQEINPEILNLLNKINTIPKIESLFYELITMPRSGSLFKFILNFHCFEKLKTSISGIAESYLKLGEFFFKDKIYPLSSNYSIEALQVYKDDANVYFLIGASLSFEACNIFKVEFFNLVLYVIKILKYRQALNYLEKALKLKPNSEKILKEIGNIHYELKDFKSSKKYCEKIIKFNPKNDWAYEKLGDICKNLSLKIESEAYYKKATELKGKLQGNRQNTTTFPDVVNPNNISILGSESVNILLGYAKALSMCTQNIDGAFAEFQNANALIIKDIDYYIYEAYAYKNSGFPQVANFYMESALTILENNIVFIKQYTNSNLNELLENNLPVKSIQKRTAIISNYFKTK